MTFGRGAIVLPVLVIVAILLGLLVLNQKPITNPEGLPRCGTQTPGGPCFSPNATASLPASTIAPATNAPATTAPATATAGPPTAGQATATVPPEDTRLVPPEDFTLVGTDGGTHTVSWVWPDDAELDPTFFRVNVSGEDHDFEFTQSGAYEVEVPALCLNNPNFLTLDAFNTDVQPEANSQAENLIEADPGC